MLVSLALPAFHSASAAHQPGRKAKQFPRRWKALANSFPLLAASFCSASVGAEPQAQSRTLSVPWRYQNGRRFLPSWAHFHPQPKHPKRCLCGKPLWHPAQSLAQAVEKFKQMARQMPNQ